MAENEQNRAGGAASAVSPPGPLDKFLNIFTDVRGGEGLSALFLFVNVFLLLSSYYLLKTIREPLVLAAQAGGAEVKSYASAAIAVLLLALVPAYGAIASRVSRVKLINGVTLFFIACLVGFFFWSRAVGIPGMAVEGAPAVPPGAGQLALGVSFFIWVGIFNLMIVAQFWAFANDVYSVEQGKRLFALVALGASLGAIAGSVAAKGLIVAYGLYPLMGLAAAILGLCMVLTNLVHVRERSKIAAGKERAAAPDEPTKADADAPITGRSGFALVMTDRYLLLIACMMLLLNLVNTTGEYILGETLTNIAKGMVAHGQLADADIGKWIGSFYGTYFTWVNVISALLQAFVVSRAIKWLGVAGALLVLPLVALGAYATLAFLPLLPIIRGAKIAENSLDYSLNNTARQTLFLPTSREAKYKAKQAVDTFFVRFGDVASAGLVFAGTTWLAFTPRHFAMVNAGLVLLWLGIAFALGRAFKVKSGETRAAEGSPAR
ncbi:MAG: Npt1/Npt2 family nucleotide transporter [Candidatus Eisenbacteria bacterium]